MHRRDLSLALIGSAAGTALLTRDASAQTCTPPCYPQTPAESFVGVTPLDLTVPSHLATGEVYPQRYGAKFDGATDDTAALNAALRVVTRAPGQVVMPGGTALISSTLMFGSNLTTPNTQSAAPTGIRGSYSSTVLKAKPGFTGTMFSATNIAGVFMRDFVLDGAGVASVCINTSWPNTVGTTALNIYEGIIVQNFLTNGWLAINDNQTKFKDITARGAASSGLSGVRIEGSGGSIFLDNVTVGDSFLSICCQSAEIHGGFSMGIRFNESQSGVNHIAFSGGTQIYANPTTQSHFEDANYLTRYVTSVVADGLYLLASSGSAPTFSINCGIGGKWIFNGGAFIQGASSGAWSLNGAHATAALNPAIVELNGVTMNSVTVNTPQAFITQRKDVQAGTVLSDYPMRTVYRNKYSLVTGLASGTYTNVIPASAMAEEAGYLLIIHVNNPGVDTLSATVFVNSVIKNGSLGASGPISIGTSANFSNNLSSQISARYSVTTLVGGNWFAGVDVAVNETLNSGAGISVTLVRIANPDVSY